jgi:hypothetical protein
MFKGMSAKCVVDVFRQAARNALDATEIFNRRRLDTIQATKLGQQLATPRRPDPGDVFEL